MNPKDIAIIFFPSKNGGFPKTNGDYQSLSSGKRKRITMDISVIFTSFARGKLTNKLDWAMASSSQSLRHNQRVYELMGIELEGF